MTTAEATHQKSVSGLEGKVGCSMDSSLRNCCGERGPRAGELEAVRRRRLGDCERGERGECTSEKEVVGEEEGEEERPEPAKGDAEGERLNPVAIVDDCDDEEEDDEEDGEVMLVGRRTGGRGGKVDDVLLVVKRLDREVVVVVDDVEVTVLPPCFPSNTLAMEGSTLM